MIQDENIMETQELCDKKKKSILKWPKVAIIILNWNGWKDTIECLESVFRNTYPNYQVIVVDNGSTDGSIEKIKAWAGGKQEVLTPEPLHPLYHLSHPPVKKPIPYIYYIRKEAEKGGNFKLEEKITKKWQEQRKNNSKELNPTSSYPLIFIQVGENLGFAGGNNVGVRYMLKKDNCEYVLLLNNDTVVEIYFLDQLIKTAKINMNIGIVGGKILYYNVPNKIWYAGGRLSILKAAGYHIGYGNYDKKYYKGIVESNFITGCIMLINQKVFQNVGLLDEQYFLYVEDVDFCYRVLKEGWFFRVNLDVVIYHKVTKFKDSELAFNGIYYISRNRLYFSKKNYSFLQYINFINFWIFSRITKFTYWVLTGQLNNIKETILGIFDFKKNYMGKINHHI